MPTTDYARQNAQALGIRLDRLDMLETRLHAFIESRQRQAIVVRVTKSDELIFTGTYGTDTKAYGVRQESIFPLASITKPVIAALLLCLQEDGLVDLNDPIQRYLPEFTGGGREKIALWHFLTHSSGIFEGETYTDTEIYLEKEWGIKALWFGSPEEQREFRKLLCEKMDMDPDNTTGRLSDPYYMLSLRFPIHRDPQTQMDYCNYGYQRLKNIIDVVTGEPIDDYARRRLFDPLQMPDTYWQVPSDKWERIIGRNEECTNHEWFNSERCYQSESGAGGLKSTAVDITNFAQMILNDGIFDGKRVLSRYSVLETKKNHNKSIPCVKDYSYSSWGLGWNIRGEKKDDTGILRPASCMDHSGAGGTKIIVDPENDMTMAIFSVEYMQDPFFNIAGPLANILYSALE